MQSRLAIGTVQFGLPYGVANQTGQVSYLEGERILQVAAAAGINTIDTAMAYGSSEQVLGQIGVRDWRVITKLPGIPDNCHDPQTWIRDNIQKSLERLHIERLAGILLHRPLQLLEGIGPGIYETLIEMKRQGLVEKFGFSIYSPNELDELWAVYPSDIVQAPFNVLDRRLQASGWLTRLRSAGTEIHARSIFLQGLLLMERSNRPIKFQTWAAIWQEWERWLADQQLTPLQACVGFAMAQTEFDRIVVGIDCAEHLNEILAATQIKSVVAPTSLVIEDENLINPSRWNV